MPLMSLPNPFDRRRRHRRLRHLPSPPDLSGHLVVFVAGLHRSGTSILYQQLRDHPVVSGFADTGVPEDEGQHLQSVFANAQSFGGPGRFAFDPAARLTEADAAALPSARYDLLLRQWGAHWDTSRPVLLEKSPPTLIRSRFFQTLFPASRFVFIVRHPLAVAYATLKWSKTTVAEAVCHWSVAHAVMCHDLARLRHVMVLRYEDYATDPEGAQLRIDAFLDLPPHRSAKEMADRNARYFALWEDDISIHEPMRDIFGTSDGFLRRFGYRLEPPYVEPWPGLAAGGAG
jgi:hypothetical protein